jgi:hypothetical protein
MSDDGKNHNPTQRKHNDTHHLQFLSLQDTMACPKEYTIVVVWSVQKMQQEENFECIICYEKLLRVAFSCPSCICKMCHTCVRIWLRSVQSCPLCRQFLNDTQLDPIFISTTDDENALQLRSEQIAQFLELYGERKWKKFEAYPDGTHVFRMKKMKKEFICSDWELMKFFKAISLAIYYDCQRVDDRIKIYSAHDVIHDNRILEQLKSQSEAQPLFVTGSLKKNVKKNKKRYIDCLIDDAPARIDASTDFILLKRTGLKLAQHTGKNSRVDDYNS